MTKFKTFEPTHSEKNIIVLTKTDFQPGQDAWIPLRVPKDIVVGTCPCCGGSGEITGQDGRSWVCPGKGYLEEDEDEEVNWWTCSKGEMIGEGVKSYEVIHFSWAKIIC